MPPLAARSPPLHLLEYTEFPLVLQYAAYMVLCHFDSRTAITLVLAGQPELRELLRYAAFAAVRQRIRISFHMPPMTLPGDLRLHRPPHRPLWAPRLDPRR